MTVRRFEGAKCVGLFWLFDSVEKADHAAARALCAACPVRNECADQLRDVQRDSIGTGKCGIPVGTWAGRLVTAAEAKRLPRADCERRPQSLRGKRQARQAS